MELKGKRGNIMPTWTNINSDEFEDFQIAFNNYMRFFTSKLNSRNVKRLDTNETVIKSADGTTEIEGPILVQKDSNGTTRLMQGYDKSTDTFVYALFNASGNQTVGIDSSGNATFTGDITGSSISGSDITGGTLTGGTIRTAETGNDRIELKEAGLTSYNSNDQKEGLSIETGDWGYSRLNFYAHNGLKVGGIYYDSYGGFHLYTASDANMYISPDSNRTCSLEGNMKFTGDVSFTSADSITGLITGTQSNHNHGGRTGYASGEGLPSHSHSISFDGSHSHSIILE